MKQILPAIFTSVWKRKESKIYLLFVLFPVIFLLASFFGKSNFMQISVIGDNRVSGYSLSRYDDQFSRFIYLTYSCNLFLDNFCL